ncbi:TonB family protein [Bordetella avium]|uniref:TonB family protein n=1 Tax=Bordetella avium TaxID=521 RepID=UPI000E69DA26|nr:TonB family protein [Bordetella avium]AZY53742.1 energy transducer TonB [Bordetella avium]RIQ19710.1 energy transducer TonB [Bordetella avium]RIQ34290.1 energy transducer TonB [Bordetella avium]RIQ70268.1 energy transducer TonB [Bordetella avium]
MHSSLPAPSLAPDRHYLLVAIVISLLIHGGLLAWRFQLPAAPPPPLSSLDITLVNAHTDDAPIHAQVLAQASVDGGGNAQAGVASTSLPRTGDAPDTIVLEAMRKRQTQLEQEQTLLLSQLRPADPSPVSRAPAQFSEDRDRPGEHAEDQPGVVQNAQVATLANRVQSYSALPRKTFVAPAAQASHYAAYLDNWRAHIEAIGTEHFPAEARGRIYGSLRITMTLRSDGSLAGFEIDKPSAHAVLNQAARRIVQMAAPFAPFPPDLARETDELVITRTWNFVNDSLETSAP